MKKTMWLRKVLLWGVLLFLLAVPIQMHADSPSAGNSIDGLPVISADPEREVYPAIAYNTQRQEYLVVWYNDRAGCDDVRAQRVATNGDLLGGSFYISAGCPVDRRYPDVTYNTAHDQYLVVWEQEDASTGSSIQARRVSGTGQVLDATDIPVRGAGGNTYTPARPAVAYASTADRYLVVWAETWHPLPISYEIDGQVMTDAGSLDGASFTISGGLDNRQVPDVAYNRHANRYLVVWQQQSGSLSDIHGQQVHGGGGLYQGDIPIAYYSTSSTAPVVAAIPTTPTDTKFLVVFELQYAPGDRDIYGHLVKEDGTLGAGFFISWDSGVDENSPAIAGSENSLRYFVVWRHPLGVVDQPIRGAALSYQGAFQSPIVEFSGVAADHPALAAGPFGEFLIAWQDQPISATNTNIYGSLWGKQVYLPFVVRNKP